MSGAGKTRAQEKFEPELLQATGLAEEWDGFVDRSPQGSIFCRSWWLQAVCPDSYEILVLRQGGRIVAGMPLTYAEDAHSRVIQMPPLTQTLGAVLEPPRGKTYERELSHEMDLLSALVEAIPDFRYFSMRFHRDFTNWLPFYWAGYQQTTRYTYVLSDLTDLDAVVAGFAHMKRKNIKKAEKLVELHEDLAPQDFYTHHVTTLRKQGDTVSYSPDLLERICNAAHANQAGRVFYASDAQGRVHAAILIVFDTKSAYYLISSIDPDYRYSGAATLLVRHAIAYASQRAQCFDFEGSMIRGVEHSFRKFGARQSPYFSITKDNRPFSLRACGALYSEGREAFGRLWRRG